MISAAGTLKTLFISSPDCSFLWKGSRLLPCVHQQCANLGARIVFHMRRHIENHRCPLLGLIGLPFRYGGIVRVAGCGKIYPGIAHYLCHGRIFRAGSCPPIGRASCRGRVCQYELRISDWSSELCSSDLIVRSCGKAHAFCPASINSARTSERGSFSTCGGTSKTIVARCWGS